MAKSIDKSVTTSITSIALSAKMTNTTPREHSRNVSQDCGASCEKY